MTEEPDRTDQDAVDREREMTEHEREAAAREESERRPVDPDVDQPAPPGQGPHSSG